MAGIYVAYPFCAQKCTFCNFGSGVFGSDVVSRYLSTLLDEIRAHRWRWRPQTLYLGGGTPSLMAPSDLRALLDALPGRPWDEATIEAAPGTVTDERIELWTACGINRVSLGVQSFVTAELRTTGRRHTAAIVADEVARLRRAGLHDFNIDLIAGLPGQTAAGWAESLDRIAELEAPHVSIYMLEVDDDSRLGRELLRGGDRYGAATAPSEEQVAEFYETAVDRLSACGIARYEISNFARPGWESKHNLKYWTLEEYAGFGADAHSLLDGVRRGNAETVADYLAGRTGESVPADPATERYWVGLRLMAGVERRAGEFDDAIDRLIRAGLLEQAGNRIRLTSRGVLLSNEVFQEFLSPTQASARMG